MNTWAILPIITAQPALGWKTALPLYLNQLIRTVNSQEIGRCKVTVAYTMGTTPPVLVVQPALKKVQVQFVVQGPLGAQDCTCHLVCIHLPGYLHESNAARW